MSDFSKQSGLFALVYKQLSESNKPYSIMIGKVQDDHPGAFVPYSKNSGGTITFKNEASMKTVDVFSEELFHAYQDDVGKLYEKNKPFNVEFEARIAKHFMAIESGNVPIFLYNGAEDYISSLDKLLNYSSPKAYHIFNKTINLYIEAANKYSLYNEERKIGNIHYWESTEQSPKALIKLIQDESKNKK